MSKCINHPDKFTHYVCRNCGKSFCNECLVEVGDYYYCLDAECQKIGKSETNLVLPSIEITCPLCSSILEVSEKEQTTGLIHCPECNSAINIQSEKNEILEPKEYVELLSSVNQGDIGIIKSLLDEGNIDYHLLGENFLAMEPLLQPARIFILKTQIDEVKEILKDFKPHIFGVSSKNYADEED